MTTTTNISEFGIRERIMAKKLLHPWNKDGLPDNFSDDEVTIMMNKNSGYTFLTNADYEVAIEVNGKLEIFYTTPYEGLEGTAEEMKHLLNTHDTLHEEDRDFIKEILAGR